MKLKRPTRRQLLNLVITVANTQYERLAPLDRAKLLEGFALILPKKKAACAKHTAALIRMAEESQMQFAAVLHTEDKQ